MLNSGGFSTEIIRQKYSRHKHAFLWSLLCWGDPSWNTDRGVVSVSKAMQSKAESVMKDWELPLTNPKGGDLPHRRMKLVEQLVEVRCDTDVQIVRFTVE